MPSPERQILRAPDVVARAAVGMVRDPEQRWMLRQPREVRRSYAAEVLDAPDQELRQQMWMLSQRKAVRESYIAEVLEAEDPPPLQEIWMLRQTDAVRRSFVDEVLRAGESLR